MIIIFGNQKGGAGKSTLAILYANWLTLVKKQKVTVLDMDYQQSLYAKYKEAEKLENPAPYEVMLVDLQEFPAIYKAIGNPEDEIIIIDLPGKLDDDHLIPVIQAADIIIVPFKYERMTYESTMLFTLISKKINPSAEYFFVPNMVQRNANYELKNDVDTSLTNYGKVTESIYQSVKYERLMTKDLPMDKIDEIESAFNKILNHE